MICTFTFECFKCGVQREIMRDNAGVDKARLKCSNCNTRSLRRIYAPVAVKQDTFVQARDLASLMPVDERPVPRAESNSELKRILRKHDEKYGTNLEVY